MTPCVVAVLVQSLWLSFLKCVLSENLRCDGLSVTANDSHVDCYAIRGSTVTISCTYNGTRKASDLNGAYWEIRYANTTKVAATHSMSHGGDFTVPLSVMSVRSSLTINQVSDTINASHVQCYFSVLGAPPEAGSGMIQVLIGNVPTISCKQQSCCHVNNSKAEISCEISGTPRPSTKVGNWFRVNSNGLNTAVDSSRFSIANANSSMPILTIHPVIRVVDVGSTYSIASENILWISKPDHWNISRVFDNDGSSHCQLIDNTIVRLNCSFRAYSQASITWNINNIIDMTVDVNDCACLVTSTVLVNLTDLPDVPTCTALINGETRNQYPYESCRPTPTSLLTSSPTSVLTLTLSATSRPASVTNLRLTSESPRSTTESTLDEKSSAGLRAAVGTLAACTVIFLLAAVYFFYLWRRLSAVGDARKSNTTEMNEEGQTHVAATYETVVDTGRRTEVLTRSPLYEDSTVTDNPSYGVTVVTDQDQTDRH